MAQKASSDDRRPEPPRSLEEALARLEPLAGGRAQLVVTSGSADLRLAVERNAIEVELDGGTLPKGASGDKGVVRAVLDTLFWEIPAHDVTPLVASAAPDPSRPRLRVERPDVVREVVKAIADEASKLEPVRKRVATLQMVAQAQPPAKTAQGGSPAAAKLRAALVAKNEVLLADWARDEGLDAVDAASAANELAEAGEARIAKKPDGSGARAEAGLKGGGYVPGLRLERAARALQPRDPVRSGRTLVRAGWERLAAGRPADASLDFQQALAVQGAEVPAELQIAAREGLLAALDAEGEAAKRAGQESVRTGGEVKRIASELGQIYAALKMPNRARVALERAIDDTAPLPSQLELLRAQIHAGQLARALDRAEALAPRLDRAARRRIATELLELGPKGPSLDRVVALAGARAEKRASLLALVVAAVAGLLAVAAGGEAMARTALAAASAQVAADLEKSGPSPELAQPLDAVAGTWSVAPAGARARELSAAVAALAADAQLLRENADALAWRRATDATAARERLRALREKARTQALRDPITSSLAAIETWHKELRADLDALRVASQRGDSVAALDLARKMTTAHAAWRSSWKDLAVPIRVVAQPQDVVVTWNGNRIAQIPPVLNLRLDGTPGELEVSASGYVPYARTLSIGDPLLAPVVVVNLERDPKFTRRPANAATNQGTSSGGATGGTGATPGTGPAPTKKIVIAVGEAAPATDPKAVAERNRMAVVDADGEALHAQLGGAPIEVQASPGYFDFLKREVTDRFRLTVEILTVVGEDRKIYLEGVKLRLVDTVLGKGIPARIVECDPPCERPLQGMPGGGRAVLPLTRTIHLDQAKFKDEVLSELKQMIVNFNKSETR